MSDLDDMVLFASVVEHGGYSAASRATGVATSRLSRRIALLEQRLGVRLLQRSSRRVSVTDIGRTFHAHCTAMLADARAAFESVERTHAAPCGRVRMSCPIPLLQAGVGVVVSRFLGDHPEVRIELEATNRRVDVVEEGFDIALRVRTPPLADSGLVTRPLASSPGLLVGSPWLFARHGRPQRADDLQTMPTLDMSRPNGQHVWRFETADGSEVTVAHSPRLVTDDFGALRQAALDGVGVAALPRFVVEADVASGALERVLPELSSPVGLVHAVFASRRGLLPAVRMLIDALVVAFESQTV